ncbi:MAG: riboflavin biosynthesis protein RibF, partial [Bacteroidaceae bacterium]
HQYLLKQVADIARSRQLKSGVVTFRQHPREIINPKSNIPLLTTLDEKLQLIDRCGIDYAALLDFTPEMSQVTAFDYMKNTLKEKLGAKVLVIGYDHRFGCKNGDGFEEYEQYGRLLDIEVIKAKELPPQNDLKISSTTIRTALKEGNITLANQLLGYNYTMSGSVNHGQAIGRSIGFPTANITPCSPNKIVPQNGVYAVRATIEEKRHHGMLYIGNRPTLHNLNEQRIEVNLFDFNEEIYQKDITVEFLARIRGEQRFDTLSQLKTQLEKDKATALSICHKISKTL